MFIEENEPIQISIFYRKLGKGYVAYTEEGFKQAKLDPSLRLKYKNVNIWMKPLTWELYNDLQEKSMSLDEMTGKKKFNYKLFKEYKLTDLILKWDAKTVNEKGESIDVPINKKNIMTLSPDIAEAILEGYDQASLLSEEDEKKL